MNMPRNIGRFFEVPNATVYLLMAANIVIYGLCLNQSGAVAIPIGILFRDGAMYSFAIPQHQYWRLIAYGFLHANLFHLATNMLCLALWGGHLEKRVGSLYFLIIYLCGLVFGAYFGNFTHHGPYLTVGASGATSGILGALLCLWILGTVNLTANFFVVNIGLNIVLALNNLKIDWGVHLGGFAAGLIACAMLDLAEKASRFVLRCKFPEFVKVNIFLAGCITASLLWFDPLTAFTPNWDGWLPALEYAVAVMVFVKLVDVVLSLKHGLAIIVIGLAVANAGVIAFAGARLASIMDSGCRFYRAGGTFQFETLLGLTCWNPGLTIGIVAACALVLTIFLYSQELERGIKDVGFVASSLRAERMRRQGI
jgi:membrane associated rhomboid family serine protease